MKINTKFLQLHQKDGVTSVTGVTRSADGCFSCNTKNSQGVTPKNRVTDKFLHTAHPEKTARSQDSGATQNNPAMPEHVSVEANSAQAKPVQQAENGAERLAAWERGEWVTIPHTAESLEIYRALELEHRANQAGRPEVAEELSRALTTIDQIDQQQRPDDFAFTLSVLRSAAEDAACHLSRKRAAA